MLYQNVRHQKQSNIPTSHANEDINWSTFKEETLTLYIALLHQH